MKQHIATSQSAGQPNRGKYCYASIRGKPDSYRSSEKIGSTLEANRVDPFFLIGIPDSSRGSTQFWITPRDELCQSRLTRKKPLSDFFIRQRLFENSLCSIFLEQSYNLLKQKKRATFAARFSAEREGFEPPVPLSTAVFKTAVIDHSTTFPMPNM